MKYYITYFYQVRFLKPNMIPFSTALYDPKWFHTNGGTFFDKNGVINGLRAEFFQPEKSNDACISGCDKDPTKCSFLKKYYEQLKELDFNSIKEYLESIAYEIQAMVGFTEEPEIVLLVYETPDNMCSERGPLERWFKENGIELEEFKRK